jgi:hypothetical protein
MDHGWGLSFSLGGCDSTKAKERVGRKREWVGVVWLVRWRRVYGI